MQTFRISWIVRVSGCAFDVGLWRCDCGSGSAVAGEKGFAGCCLFLLE